MSQGSEGTRATLPEGCVCREMQRRVWESELSRRNSLCMAKEVQPVASLSESR